MDRVAATAFSAAGPLTTSGLALATGPVQCPRPATPGYWYVVVDLTDGLQVRVNTFSADPTAPPEEVAALLGRSDCFLFCIAQVLPAALLPSGALDAFLRSAGAGTQLAGLQQAASLLGPDVFPAVGYALAATLNDQDLPGFEEASLWTSAVLNMQFVGLEVDGRTIYAPVQIGTHASPNMVRAVQSVGASPAVVFVD